MSTTDTQLEAFAALVRACPHNLLSKRDLEGLEERHFPECLEVAQRLPACEVVGDLGSGGGLPALIIAIARPDLEIHCIEATAKKAEFLFDTAEKLSLNVQVHNARAEDLSDSPLAGFFPVLTARAVARLPKLLTWAMPLVADGGEFWAIKGDQWPQEVREARQDLRKLQSSLLEVPDEHPNASNNLARVVRIAKN